MCNGARIQSFRTQSSEGTPMRARMSTVYRAECVSPGADWPRGEGGEFPPGPPQAKNKTSKNAEKPDKCIKIVILELFRFQRPLISLKRPPTFSKSPRSSKGGFHHIPQKASLLLQKVLPLH